MQGVPTSSMHCSGTVVVIMATQHEVDAPGLARAYQVIGQAHVRERYHELGALLLREPKIPSYPGVWSLVACVHQSTQSQIRSDISSSVADAMHIDGDCRSTGVN